MNLMAGWSARALARLLDIPAATVSAWVSSGLITPEQFGRGRAGHLIGISGLMELLAVIELRHAGFSIRAIRRAVENLRELSGLKQPLAQLALVVRGNDMVWVDRDDFLDIPISTFQQPGQRLMILPVGEMHEAFLQERPPNSVSRVESTNIDLGEVINAS